MKYLIFIILCISTYALYGVELVDNSTELTLGGKLFPQKSKNSRQSQFYPELSFEGEYIWQSEDNEWLFAPFWRWSYKDSDESYGDMREAYWRKKFDSGDLTVGLRRIFWGTLEAANPVNVINQSDYIVGIEREDKLGQPLASWSWLLEEGELELFMLPWFRPRPFPGLASRPTTSLAVDNHERYESSHGKHRIDWAMRWYRPIGQADVGLSFFSGTRRSPILTPSPSSKELQPYYVVNHHLAIDMSLADGNWLWKLELMGGQELNEGFSSVSAGLEYTITGIMESRYDLGLIAEAYRDDRNAKAAGWWQQDIAVGGRLSLNDAAGSEIKLLYIQDFDYKSSLIKLDAGMRIGEKWKLSLLTYVDIGIDQQDPHLGFLKDNSWSTIEMTYYY
ncbi:hypothetical protein [Zooshikella ganghwensis]|uniref:Uncharacterized protein n=1 Tax=Zooshikella ganghwensis TaxID=202772 RepID=A0A4V1IP91_9GAMM|nr:hypothetical protein [Zooshikella ganghwensis]RDH46411.1 hypothetical protein B9G39_24800 [Zooshikella ganghwensis]